jgi:glutamine synthetase
MLVKPVPETAFIDPFFQAKTLVMICNICDPIHGGGLHEGSAQHCTESGQLSEEHGHRRTRPTSVRRRSFSSSTISASTRTSDEGYYHIDSVEGRWNSGSSREPQPGYKSGTRKGTSPCLPTDSQQDIRSEMMLTLEKIGVLIEAQHHEVATGGQAEIDMRFAPLVEMATIS